MIGYIEGVVRLKRPGALIVLTGGVGYPVQVTQPTYLAYDLGDTIALMVETKVSENDFTFYGFETEAEQDLFVTLCKVQKVGGKVALAILGALGHEGFCRAITDKDEKALKSVSGVGASMAQRLLAESGVQKFVSANYTPSPESGKADAVQVLVMNGMKAMGYAPAEIEDLVRKVIADVGASVGAPILISEALRRKSQAA